MDSIPLHLQTAFETILRNRSVPAGLHPLYIKWLRFYLDFCRKYHFTEIERKSLDPKILSTEHVKAFLTFLAVTKKVSASTQNQAFNALLFFTGMF